MFLHRFGKVRAPEFPAGLNWLNGEPQSVRALKGKVVLLDFWTSSCINCVRTFPFLNKWAEKYADFGLRVIGIHTPEFSFEKADGVVRAAIERYELNYPIALDSEYKVWEAYGNKWWPRVFLLGADGQIVYDHIGEGGYGDTERAIQQALLAAGAQDLPLLEVEENYGGSVCHRVTPEVYLGYVAGKYANKEALAGHTEEAYTDTKEKLSQDMPLLHGHWQIEQEFVEHTRDLPIYTEYLTMKYSAFAVNLVAGGERGSVIKIDLDHKPLPKDMAGSDVTYDTNGQSQIKIDDTRIYNILNSETYHRGQISLRVKDAGLRFYSFTFNGCKGM